MDIKACYKVGYILKPHGLKGGVAMSLDAEAPAMDGLQSLFMEKNNRLIPLFIQDISVRGDKAFVKFEDVNTPEEAQKICKSAVYLSKETREKSGRGEFYDDEIIGFEVVEAELGSLGFVQSVVTAGPNKLLSVDNNGKEILIPVIGPFISSVNKSRKKISVELPEGFLDI